MQRSFALQHVLYNFWHNESVVVSRDSIKPYRGAFYIYLDGLGVLFFLLGCVSTLKPPTFVEFSVGPSSFLCWLDCGGFFCQIVF